MSCTKFTVLKVFLISELIKLYPNLYKVGVNFDKYEPNTKCTPQLLIQTSQRYCSISCK